MPTGRPRVSEVETLSEGEANRLVELGRVRRRRYREARKAGMSRDEARVFAYDDALDIGELRRLVAGRCPSEQIAAILL